MCHGECEEYLPSGYCLPHWNEIDRINNLRRVISMVYAFAFGVFITMLIEWALWVIDFNFPNIALFGMFWVIGLCITVYCDQALEELRLRR